MQEKDVVVMKGDEDSSVVILNKTDYIEKLENMVKEGIDKGTYTLTEDNTIKDLKNFKQFLNEISKNMINSKILYQHLTNQPEYMFPLKHINFHLLIA